MSERYEIQRKMQRDSEAREKLTLGGEYHSAFAIRPADQFRGSRQLAPETPDWHRALNILRKHWRPALVFAALVFVSVAAVTMLMKPVYEPVARLEVDPPGSEAFSMQGSGAGQSPSEYAETKAKNLQSDQLAMEVIRKLGLQINPDFAPPAANSNATADGAENGAENTALRNLNSRLRVTRDASSHLVFVSVAAHDPVLAAQVTNTLVEQFIEREYQMRHDAVMESAKWLERELDDIRARMEQSNRTLADFENASGIAAVGDNQNTFSEKMTELNHELVQAQSDRIQMQSFLKMTEQPAGSLPQVSGNAVVQQLTQKLAETRADLAQSLAIYGKNHPNAKRLQNQVDELQTQIANQRSAIMNDLRSGYAAAQSREALVQAQVKDATRQMSLLAEYSALKKEADTNSQLYNTLYQRIKESSIAAEAKSSNLRLVDPARVLDRPTRPHRALNLVAGGLAGIFGGIVLAFVCAGLDTTIRTAEEVRQYLGAGSVSVVPVIGKRASDAKGGLSLPSRKNRGVPTTFLLDRPNSPEAEALRSLYTSVRLSQRDRALQTILVASPYSGEGKTTLSANLAIALAQQGSTCIVDTDLRKPGVAAVFGMTTHHGLSDVLVGAKTVDDVLLKVPRNPNLALLPTGPTTLDPAKLVTSEAMAELMRELRERFEFVLVDSPPVLPFADARALSTMVDGVVLVGRSGVTKRESLARAMELLEEVHSAPIVDVVLNAAKFPAIDYRYYRYGYGKGSVA